LTENTDYFLWDGSSHDDSYKEISWNVSGACLLSNALSLYRCF
jgi:hypothetical protein